MSAGAAIAGTYQQQKALGAQKGAQRLAQAQENMRTQASMKQREQDSLSQAQGAQRVRNAQTPVTSNGLDVGAATAIGGLSGTF